MACLHFPMVATGTNKGGMFLWCGLQPFVVVWWNFHVAGWNFEEILQHYKKGFSSSLNVTVGYFCMQSLPEWAGMFVSELERRDPSWKTGIITHTTGTTKTYV